MSLRKRKTNILNNDNDDDDLTKALIASLELDSKNKRLEEKYRNDIKVALKNSSDDLDDIFRDKLYVTSSGEVYNNEDEAYEKVVRESLETKRYADLKKATRESLETKRDADSLRKAVEESLLPSIIPSAPFMEEEDYQDYSPSAPILDDMNPSHGLDNKHSIIPHLSQKCKKNKKNYMCDSGLVDAYDNTQCLHKDPLKIMNYIDKNSNWTGHIHDQGYCFNPLSLLLLKDESKLFINPHTNKIVNNDAIRNIIIRSDLNGIEPKYRKHQIFSNDKYIKERTCCEVNQLSNLFETDQLPAIDSKSMIENLHRLRPECFNRNTKKSCPSLDTNCNIS